MMWERIAVSSILMIGAVILFVLFTAALFVIEKKNSTHTVTPQRKPARKAVLESQPDVRKRRSAA